MLPKVILIACGSFSPPTPMHFRMFEIARDYFQQMGTHEVVGGIVSPVHDSYGKKGLVVAKHRIAMLKLALKSSEWIRMSDWETQQDGWTRTRITLQYHQNYINSLLSDDSNRDTVPSWLPGNLKQMTGTVQVKLLCGADLLESWNVPGLWENDDIEAILGHHGIVVISRSGSNPEQFIFNSDLLSKYRRNIEIVTNWVPNEVSSSMIRRLVSRGQSVKYLLDDSVIEYIMKNSLFGANSHKYILTPNHNEMAFLQTPSPGDGIVLNLHKVDNSGHQRQFEDMDETDYLSQKSPESSTNGSGSVELVRPKMFCCGDSLNMKTLRNRPGQAVQIRTDASGSHSTFDTDEVKNKKLKTTACPL
ncbi:nicotinamide/nicotinic acid mononucleotide adenylyltransferase 3 isoform X3 [Phlebotomus papatasi]|uniref:nicotinamide/nicotinic acid mononucleotide adenylyltransferase 3 isoform X3 n=1 Tax=Phlebotomus papatasi TaxID=29031 RepID=UPI002484737D|nr:nicotinamide/nicotinic acid mononucleotide adenylyltransferase 3 isoform X3 [Phlebotomus papatasi]